MLVVVIDCLIDLVCKFIAAANLRGQKFPEGNLLPLLPGLQLPELRTNEGLGTVEKTFPHGNSNRQQRGRTAGAEPDQQIGIFTQLCGTVDAKGLVGAGHEKKSFRPADWPECS